MSFLVPGGRICSGIYVLLYRRTVFSCFYLLTDSSKHTHALFLTIIHIHFSVELAMKEVGISRSHAIHCHDYPGGT